MRVVWHGHACFEVNDGVTIVTDPHDGEQVGLAPPSVEADIVLISHDHYDHNCGHVVKGDPKIINRSLDESVMGTHMRSFETYHDEVKGQKRGRNRIYLFEMEGIRFLHLGDLGHLLADDLVSTIGRVDVLFVPVGSVFTIGGEAGWRTVNQIKPRVAVPMHYWVKGLSLSIRPLEDFLDVVDVPITKVGNEVTFEKEDLPESTEVWVFNL